MHRIQKRRGFNLKYIYIYIIFLKGYTLKIPISVGLEVEIKRYPYKYVEWLRSRAERSLENCIEPAMVEICSYSSIPVFYSLGIILGCFSSCMKVILLTVFVIISITHKTISSKKNFYINNLFKNNMKNRFFISYIKELHRFFSKEKVLSLSSA